MSGWISNGVGQLGPNSGVELINVDSEKAQGQAPQTASMSLIQAAIALVKLQNSTSKTLVAGSRYYTSFQLGYTTQLTGIEVLIGGTGGTDKWLVELHDSAGNLLATSATAGATVGTAGTWQQFAFTAAYTAAPGTYFLTVQTNGTTATLGTLNAPFSTAQAAANGLVTGSATGTFGTGAAFTPATTYTANLGPIAQPYI